GDHVPVRVALRLLGGDLAAVHELLHHGVVDADLLEDLVGEPVDAGVAEVEDHPVGDVVDHHRGDQGDGGAGREQPPAADLGDAPTGRAQGVAQLLDGDLRLQREL